MKKKGFTPKNEYISVDDCNKDYSKSTGFARYEKYLQEFKLSKPVCTN
jgi:hypothetical protein